MNKEAEELAKAIGNPVLTAFDQEGLTPRYLAKKHKKELNAKKIDTFKGKVVEEQTDDGGKVIGRTEREVVIYSKPLIAWDTRQKARQDAHKLRGDYPPEKSEFSGPKGEPIQLTVKYEDTGNGNDSPNSKTI